jgi:Ca2+-binding RTX toxin-like protein
MLDNYLPDHPQIKAFVWFNWNAPQFDGPHQGERWDWPIESSASAEAAFRSSIGADRYLSTLPPLTPLAKVPPPQFPPPPQTPTSAPAAAPEVEACPDGRPVAHVTVGTADADLLIGTEGDDRIGGARGNDRIRGLAGADCLFGDPGRDTIQGGPGKDSIYGRSGKDLIKTSSGGRDLVDCGKGQDRAVVSRNDRVKRCEKVRTD